MHSKTAIGRRVGKSRPYVVKRMRLLRLHPDLREAIRQGTLSPEHGQELLKLEDPSQQVALAEQIVKEGLRDLIMGVQGIPNVVATEYFTILKTWKE